MVNTEQIIDRLDLSAHPEGGYYRETYKSKQQVSLFDGERCSAGTGIYFLLPQGELSNWHRVSSDEVWHFYHGAPLILEVIDQDGAFKKWKLGNTFARDIEFQRLVPQNCWQRAYSTGEYSLVGCTVSPGFEFEDFEMIDPKNLAEKYPQIKEEILTSPV